MIKILIAFLLSISVFANDKVTWKQFIGSYQLNRSKSNDGRCLKSIKIFNSKNCHGLAIISSLIVESELLKDRDKIEFFCGLDQVSSDKRQKSSYNIKKQKITKIEEIKSVYSKRKNRYLKKELKKELQKTKQGFIYRDFSKNINCSYHH